VGSADEGAIQTTLCVRETVFQRQWSARFHCRRRPARAPEGPFEARDRDSLHVFLDENGRRLYRVWGSSDVSEQLRGVTPPLAQTQLRFPGGMFSPLAVTGEERNGVSSRRCGQREFGAACAVHASATSPATSIGSYETCVEAYKTKTSADFGFGFGRHKGRKYLHEPPPLNRW
jgi:hypothetical protein